MKKKQNRKKRILNHLGKVGMAIITFSRMTSPSLAIDPTKTASQTIGAEDSVKMGKEALNGALKMAKSKPAMSTAPGIVCLTCIPAAGVAASPGLCIACRILLAKTFG